MKPDEKIADKIQKLLDLAGNNPNENEAKAALLKAQELMAKYNIEQEQLHPGEKIKYSLELAKCKITPRDKQICVIIANSFACKVILTGGQKRYFGFFGREDNAKAAASAMDFIHKVLEQGIRRVCAEHGLKASQAGAALIYNSYAIGFIHGLKDTMNAQTKALAVVVPQDVRDKFNERFTSLKSARKSSIKYSGDTDVMNKGYIDGKSAMTRRSPNP